MGYKYKQELRLKQSITSNLGQWKRLYKPHAVASEFNEFTASPLPVMPANKDQRMKCLQWNEEH